MTSSPIVVVKLGGSLLDWPEWPARLGATLATLADRRVTLVVGGGQMVDIVRDLDRVHAPGDEAAHALAMHALGTTARLAALLLPNSTLIRDLADLPTAWFAGLLPVLDPDPILAAIEAQSGPLPRTWDLTSDSIAARVATHLHAAELILLKSSPLPDPLADADAPDWSLAAALGLVDPEFPRLAAPIPQVRFVSLRDGER